MNDESGKSGSCGACGQNSPGTSCASGASQAGGGGSGDGPESSRRKFFRIGLGSAVAAAGMMAFPKWNGLFAEEKGPCKDKDCATQLPVLSAEGKLLDPLSGKEVTKSPSQYDRAGFREIREGIPNRRWVMVIDLAECDGCEKCTTTCAKAHNTPPERQWIRVFKMQGGQGGAGKNAYWFPKPCFHCDDPPCTRVCPVDATYKRQDGIVLIDNERCIGCRFCMAACPYSTRYFNWGQVSQASDGTYTPEKSSPRRVGTVEKCDFCPDMLRQGQMPHCASSCKMGAIMFGDENEDAVTDYKGRTYRLSKLLQEKGGYRYLEELGTKPRVYYLPSKNPTYDPPVIDHSEPPIIS